MKRLNEVNVSPVPARRQDSDEAPKSKPSAAPATGIAAVKQEPPKAAAQPASVEQELIDVFRSGYKEVGKKPHSEDQPKKKWGLIGGVAAGVVVLGLAVGIPLAVRGRNVSAARSVAAPTTTTITDEVSSAPKPSPSSPVSAVPAAKQNQQPNAEQQQATESDASANQASVSADMMNQQLNAGSQLPQGARQKASEVAPPPSGFGVAGMETSNDPSAIGGVFKSQSRTVIGPSSVKVSAGVAGGMLIRKTPPEYPTIAKTARVAGTVVLAATITKSGRVSNLQVISGPAMLRQAAMDAVRNWLYKPYLLNNQPTEVQTTINVDFNL
ncbi:MAG TPA: energy transducer TonB [Terracidiphilus sp.]|nr:energy transducer TonB [Terracidiphilus sp.]